MTLAPDQADLQRRQKASEDLQDVTELAKSTGWNRWFMAKLSKRIAALEGEILEPIDNHGEDIKTIQARAARLALKDVQTWLGADERTARAEVERKL